MEYPEVCRIDAKGAVVSGRLLADGIRVWLSTDIRVAPYNVKEVKLPAWGVPDSKSGAPTDKKMRQAAVSPLSDCFFQFVNGKVTFHDEARIKSAPLVLESFCTPVLDEDVYAYTTVVCGVRAIVTIPSSLFGIKPFSKLPWIKAILNAPLDPPGIVRPTVPPPTAAAPVPTPEPVGNNKRKAVAESDLFPVPAFDAKDTYVSVQAMHFIEATAFGYRLAPDVMRERALVMHKAGVDAGKRLEAIYRSSNPDIVFRAVLDWLNAIPSEYFRPDSLYGVTAQLATHTALCEMEKVDSVHLRGLLTLVSASRCTPTAVTVLKGVKECRGVIQSARPDDKKVFDRFVDMAIEFVDAKYLDKTEEWHRAQKRESSGAAAASTATAVSDPVTPRKRARATLVATGASAPAASAVAAAASSSLSAAEAEDGAQPLGVDMGSDPDAALHAHCMAAHKSILDAHAKISHEVVQITHERDKLLVSLSAKSDVVNKLYYEANDELVKVTCERDQLKAELSRSHGVVRSLQANVVALRANASGASSAAAAVEPNKVASLERQLKAVNDLVTRLIREFNTIAGMTAVDRT